MLIGIISDTHDDMEAIKKSIALFNSKGAEHVIHAGDMISPFTFEVWKDLHAQFTGIFGNNDGDRVLLKNKSDGRIHNQPLMLTIDGHSFVVIHEPDIAESLAESGRFDVVICGHTHRPEIKKIKDALVINPGKAARLHKGKSTVVLLDTATMKATLVEL